MYSVQCSFWMRFRFDGKQSGDCSTCIRVQPSVGSAQHWLAPARAQAHEASACSRNMICVPSASAAPSASFFDHRLGRSREDCFCRKTPNVMVLFRKKAPLKFGQGFFFQKKPSSFFFRKKVPLKFFFFEKSSLRILFFRKKAPFECCFFQKKNSFKFGV